MATSKNTRLAHVVNLLCVAGIDGTITDEERNVIVNIAENLGLNEDDFDLCIEIWKKTDESEYETIVPEDDEDKFQYLKDLVLVMMIDGEIDDNERKYIAGLAEQFGYDGDDAVNTLIDIVYKEHCGNDEESEEEEPEDEVFDGIDDDDQIDMGKSNLQFKEIDEAFDNLFLSACRNDEAYQYLQVITNTDTRLFRLSEEQIEKVQMMADKGYPVAKYVLGRYHQVVKPDDDSIEKAADLLKAAANGEVADAYAALATMHLYGHFGDVVLDTYRSTMDDAVSKGSSLAIKIKLHEMTEGINGLPSEPKRVIDFLENNILNDEETAEKYPFFYVSLGDAYHKMGKTAQAADLYEKAEDLGFFEAAYNKCAAKMEGMAQMQKSIFDMVVDFGCDAKSPGCFWLKADIQQGEYEECTNEDKKQQISKIIKESLEEGYKLGYLDCAFALGTNYYFGKYGFEEDNNEAWNWFLAGAKMDNGASYLGLAQMTADGICPDGLADNFVQTCLLNALRRGRTEQLPYVIEAYKAGKLADFADEIEAFYMPMYGKKDTAQMECIAIVKADGNATIYKFKKDDFAKLAGFIGAKRLAPVRLDALDAIAKKAGINDHLVAYIDYEAPRKKLPMNVVAKSFFKGMIAGDIIIALADNIYDPMMFYGTDDLEKVLKALKVKNIDIVADGLKLAKAQPTKDNLDFDPAPTGFVARIEPNGTAHIVKSSVGVFAMFETDIYDPMRLDAVAEVGKKLGLKGRLTIWTDNSSVRKQLIINNNKLDANPVGAAIYPGPIADNFFVAMEDDTFNIMLFDDAEQLKQVLVALGVKPENIIKD